MNPLTDLPQILISFLILVKKLRIEQVDFKRESLVSSQRWVSKLVNDVITQKEGLIWCKNYSV